MAFIPAFSGDAQRAEEARDKVRAARAFARRLQASPQHLAWLSAVEAEVETRFDNTRQALRLIADAEHHLSLDGPAPPDWLDWFSPARLAGFKGNTLMSDNQLGPARTTLLTVLEDTSDGFVKQRTITLADLAAVEARAGDPEAACRHAVAALENLSKHWYATGMDRVRAVRHLLSQWENHPAVRDLDDRLYDWHPTVSALVP